jgi:hypothetical protein
MIKYTEQNVLDVVEKALEVSPGSLNFDTIAENVEEWDSLGHLAILTSLDNFFAGGIADINEIAEATSIPKILEILRKHSLI